MYQKYHISGELQGVKNKMIYLSNKELGINSAFRSIVHDSTFSEDGRFYFKGHYDHSDFFAIEVPEQTSAWLPFIAPPRNEKVHISGHVDSLHRAHVIGNKRHEDFVVFKDSIRNKFDAPAIELYENRDRLIGWRDSVGIINRERAKYLIAQAKLTPNNYAVSYFSYSNFLTTNKQDLTEIYNHLAVSIQRTDYGKMLFDHINSVGEGDVAYPFSLPDTLGNKVYLEDYRGSYVLLDFWASWCVPCLKELPELKELFTKLDSGKIKILGVSLDTKENLWKSSIKDNKIPWTNISDLQGNKSALTVRYRTHSVPYKVLIDPSGRIILSSHKLGDVINKLQKIGLL